jgi:hypothetical protein
MTADAAQTTSATGEYTRKKFTLVTLHPRHAILVTSAGRHWPPSGERPGELTPTERFPSRLVSDYQATVGRPLKISIFSDQGLGCDANGRLHIEELDTPDGDAVVAQGIPHVFHRGSGVSNGPDAETKAMFG